ncbi:cytochrome c3 family protein [Shewanella sp. OMA3-2]|uniref:cytochrome c3 family protein n=1 Tax=Shewanella sp. OMA3-2 TaxID=2908650 RepID=UPI001F213F7A|nr:cytochrome c3 family protein [Shewanella sp. OMA3-2]UJF23329.1 cytochrome c3 family protein [Shewanella sp. OMA3-2]
MKNTLLSCLFTVCVALFTFSVDGFAAQENLADYHTGMNGCESCHANGEPSVDGGYEFEQCQSCHGSLAGMSDNHKPHDSMLLCVDCHAVHEVNVAEQPTCEACHDDGRVAK